MGALDETRANNILNALVAAAAFSSSTAPIRVRLMTANGSATEAGVQVTNSGGSAYAPQTVTFSSAAAQQVLSNVAVTFSNMPAVTVVGLELWDSNATPRRLAWGALTAPKTTGLGDSLTINGAALSLAFT